MIFQVVAVHLVRDLYSEGKHQKYSIKVYFIQSLNALESACRKFELRYPQSRFQHYTLPVSQAEIYLHFQPPYNCSSKEQEAKSGSTKER